MNELVQQPNYCECDALPDCDHKERAEKAETKCREYEAYWIHPDKADAVGFRLDHAEKRAEEAEARLNRLYPAGRVLELEAERDELVAYAAALWKALERFLLDICQDDGCQSEFHIEAKRVVADRPTAVAEIQRQLAAGERLYQAMRRGVDMFRHVYGCRMSRVEERSTGVHYNMPKSCSPFCVEIMMMLVEWEGAQE